MHDILKIKDLKSALRHLSQSFIKTHQKMHRKRISVDDETMASVIKVRKHVV